VHVEVEIVHPTLEIVAARSEVRNGPSPPSATSRSRTCRVSSACGRARFHAGGTSRRRWRRRLPPRLRAAGRGRSGGLSATLRPLTSASLPPRCGTPRRPATPPRGGARRRAGHAQHCFSYADTSAPLIAERATPASPARADDADAYDRLARGCTYASSKRGGMGRISSWRWLIEGSITGRPVRRERGW
jgi:hypothetical protein